MFVTDRSMRPDDLARAVEDRGLRSLWVPEHTHIPTSRASPYPAGGDLPEEYARTLDPFVALTAAAAATTTLRVGTAIALVAQRDPILTAKEVASVDLLSGGRFRFGVGFGWNVEEMHDHGTEKAERRAIGRERVLAMQRLWADDEASFSGEHVTLSPSWAWPKPVQRPWPPVLVGGQAGPGLYRHVAEYGDGWIPIGGRGITKALPELLEAWDAAGRDGRPMVIPCGVLPDRGKLDHYAGLGITECVLPLPSAPADRILPILDRYAEFT
jgi:probable F420-dependent oxidoreductase